MPITRKNGNLYLEWNAKEVLYNKKELQLMHLQFFHLNANKLFNLIARAKPENATRKTKELLQQITKSCATCQRFSPKPESFQVEFQAALHLIRKYLRT